MTDNKIKKNTSKNTVMEFIHNLRLIASLFGQFKTQILIGLGFAVAATIFAVIGPKFLAKATNYLFYGAASQINGGEAINLYDFLLALFEAALIYVISAVCQLVQGIVGTNTSRKICYDLRKSLICKIHKLPVSYFETHKKGDVLSRVINDVDQLGQSIAEVFVNTVTSCTMLVGSVVMMLTINAWLTLIIVVLVPLSLLLICAIVKFSQPYFFQMQNQLGVVNSCIEETISGLELVQVYNKQKNAIADFNSSNEKLYRVSLKARLISMLSGPIMTLLNYLSYVVVVVIGAYLCVLGCFTVGDIQAFLQYVGNFTTPLSTLMGIFNTVQQMAASCERIYEFLEIPDDITLALPEYHKERKCDFLNDKNTSPIIRFENISFSYDGDKNIINDFNLDIHKGQTVALVGPTGAGKSTLVKLLLRYYDVNGGSIQINGNDIRGFSKHDLREYFAIVMQDIWFFSGTIEDNLKYGNLDATIQKVWGAAKSACCRDYIESLPNKYKSLISENASNISLGQKQLLSISRAILADREILILDEATSSVDSSTEKKLYNAFDNVMHNKTCFVIAHRLSTIKNADVILVLNNGDVVEQGTHVQLLDKHGFYYDLFMSGMYTNNQ